MKKMVLLVSGVIAIIVACVQNDSNSNQMNASVIPLGEVRTNFPETDGYELFKTNCISCHSLRYIEMQPDFPRKIWENIVHKMVKNFGAPIPDSTANAIVDYIMTVKAEQKH